MRISLWAFMLLAFLVGATPAWAGPDELATGADKLVRSAERAMFGGDKAKADAQLVEALTLIEQLAAEAPDHAKLAGLTSKYQKVRKDLDRRMGGAKKTPVPTQEATPKPATASKPAPAPKPTPSGGSRDYRLPMAQKAVTSVTKDADQLVPDLEEIFATDPTVLAIPPTAAQLRERALKRIERVVTSISKTESQYGELLGLPNAGLEGAKAKVTAAQARLEELVAGWSKRETAEAADQASAAASQEAAASDTKADVERVLALHERLMPGMEGIYGASIITASQYDGDVARAALAKLEKAEEILPELGPDLARMAKTYGTTSMEINNAFFKKLGRGVSGDPGGKLEDLLGIPELLRKSRVATGENLARHVGILTAAWSDHLTDAQMERLNVARELASVAVLIDPDSARLKELTASLDRTIEEHADRMEAAINAASWPGHVSGFAGPGSVGSLAKSAQAFFAQDRGWGGRTDRKVEILDVCVRGPWQVANRDIFGRVIRWRLPILVAVTNEDLRPRNIARVYELSIVGMEGGPDRAAQAPPWDGAWVGGNYMMRLDKF